MILSTCIPINALQIKRKKEKKKTVLLIIWDQCQIRSAVHSNSNCICFILQMIP